MASALTLLLRVLIGPSYIFRVYSDPSWDNLMCEVLHFLGLYILSLSYFVTLTVRYERVS